MIEPKWKERVMKDFVEVGIDCEEALDVVWIPSYHHHEIGFTYFPTSKHYVIGFYPPTEISYTYTNSSLDEAYKVVLRYVFEGVKPNSL